MTILEEIDPNACSDSIIDFNTHVDDDRGENFTNMRDDFKLYMDIGKYTCNSLQKMILHNILKVNRVKECDI